jgi:hypothetical protein
MIMNARNSGISSSPRCSPRAALSPTPKHMIAISPAPATGTAPDTIATGVNAVSNPTLRYAIAWPPIIRFVRATAPPSTAHDDAVTWPLIAANTANGTLRITIAATATTVRRANTCDSRGLAPSTDSVGPATAPSKRADQTAGPSSSNTVHDDL